MLSNAYVVHADNLRYGMEAGCAGQRSLQTAVGLKPGKAVASENVLCLFGAAWLST